ncbi:putative colanic acid biosynthesis acetyltransferase [Lichenihabitans sp. Uapishka_5]|uniref:putative colanic acid biosynthesis acetyltransferase n=1 Tax=Lichenihabitans sp. Uapishka_5 TaxID=3037302 RepID=UPI0029E8244C|nr:putative colanic acid biosynthesis acetyltransferase [Lichenihabitans sp. Uapishka_5]MDX7952655.1 putative colanic acid biosynthesis acetyltransferase [Lichenihabitans sp. Uapishka_5]
MTILDAHLSRPLEGGPSFSLGNRMFRLVWRLAWVLLAVWTPPPMVRWRRWLLVRFGADMAPTANVRSSARVWYPPHLSMGDHALLGPKVTCYNIAPVHLGRRVVVSQGANLCTGTHDLADRHFQLVARRIVLEDHVWIAAEAFVGPGVVARQGAVLAARGTTFTTLAAWTVYRGNPARAVKRRAFRPETAEGAPSVPTGGNFSEL